MSKKKLVWHSGRPPSVGWWPTKTTRGFEGVRWWDGRTWSVHVSTGDYKSADSFARLKASYRNSDIEWSERPKSWPARSHT